MNTGAGGDGLVVPSLAIARVTVMKVLGIDSLVI